jgi:hypothetical protein
VTLRSPWLLFSVPESRAFLNLGFVAPQTVHSSYCCPPAIQQATIDRYAELFLHNPADYIKHSEGQCNTGGAGRASTT